ncbi:MAG: hypothetical protein K6G30_05280, partial [Acetatifactor sp.]|nr:hypothetical protein [Acetatifactor sp.]
MKRNTKITAILLAVSMVCSMAACGNTTGSATSSSTPATQETVTETEIEETAEETATTAEPLEPVTLVIAMNDASGTMDDEVEAAINDLPQVKELGITIDLIRYAKGEFKEKSSLALSSGEQIDLIFDALWMTYSKRAAAGEYYDISELLKDHPKLYNAIPKTHWDAATINGGIYAVPTYKESGEQWGIYVNTKWAKDNVPDPNAYIGDIDGLNELLKKYKDDGHGPWVGTYANYDAVMQLLRMNEYSQINRAVMVDRKNPSVALNYFETDYFKKTCQIYRDWYEYGIFSSDVLTAEASYFDNFKNEDDYGFSITTYTPCGEEYTLAEVGFERTYIPISNVFLSSNACLGSLFCIPVTCEHPDRAVDFLELWNTDPEVKNLFTYGIEGKNYTLN